MKVLILHLADTKGNPRPKRFIQLFQNLGWEISVVSSSLANTLNVDHQITLRSPRNALIRISRGLVRRLLSFARNAIQNDEMLDKVNDLVHGISGIDEMLKRDQFDIILVEDLFMLPLAFRIKGTAKIIFDAREFYPSQNEERFLWRLYERPERIRLCKRYMPLCDLVMTVSPGLSDLYLKHFQVRTIVFRSIPLTLNSFPAKPTGPSVRMVHHGMANRNRNLKSLISIADSLGDGYFLDLYLVGNQREIRRLRRAASKTRNVRVLDPVEFSNIIPTMREYDMGLCFIPDSTMNLRFGLPNKFFEYVHSSLALVSGPSPDMANLINRYKCGVSTADFSTDGIVKLLKRLSFADIDAFKEQSWFASSELTFEAESRELVEIVEDWFPREG